MELSKEETYTSWNRQFTFKEASSFNKNALKMQRKNNGLALLLIKGKELVGKADLRLREGRQDHIGDLGIFIKKEYRGVGFGSILMESILVSSKKYLMNL
ncbi:GNAT family N-acetyltransferase, partial [Patescibacteria group bacterium]|nr:GNAT family N-acetyltransferase [Patescibacteria group bacterium]